MNPAFLYVVALLLALIEQFRAKGQSLLTWAVTLIAIGLAFDFIAGMLR